jgi:hypothetical protein
MTQLSRRRFFTCACCASVAGLTGMSIGHSPGWAASGKHTDLSPDQALARLKEGNQSFITDAPFRRESTDRDRRIEIARGQTPFCVLVGCSDRRRTGGPRHPRHGYAPQHPLRSPNAGRRPLLFAGDAERPVPHAGGRLAWSTEGGAERQLAARAVHERRYRATAQSERLDPVDAASCPGGRLVRLQPPRHARAIR